MRTFERRSESVQVEEKLDDVYDVRLIEQLILNKEHKLKSVHCQTRGEDVPEHTVFWEARQ